MSNQEAITRRSTLGALAAVAAIVPAAAVAAAVCPTDPIFLMIDGHRAAVAAFVAALARLPLVSGHADTPKLQAIADGAGDAAHDALVAMLTTPPTTLAGAVALLRYLSEASNMDEDYLLHNVCGDQQGYSALIGSLIVGLAPLVQQ